MLLLALFASNSVLSENIVGSSSGELRNVTVTEDVYVPDVYDYLAEINYTTWRTLWNVSYLFDRENCTKDNHIAEVGTKCWYLDLINTTLQKLNISSLELLREINATTYSTNLTATLTKKLTGNILASFGKNLYLVSNDPTTVDQNLTSHDKIYEVLPTGTPSRTYYFYLEQIPLDNLTVELVTAPYGTSATTRVNLSVNGQYVFKNWNFDRSSEAMKTATVDVGILQTGQNTFVLEVYDNSFALDYVMIFTQSAALRFLRATQYNTTNIYDYLTGTVYPYLQGMNKNISEILNDTDWIYNTLNCSDYAVVNQENYSICQRLKYIMNWTQFLRENITRMENELLSHNDTIVELITNTNNSLHARLLGMNVTLEEINLKVGEIRNMTNCTANTVQDALCEKLDNITYHVLVVNSTANTIRIFVTEINTTTHWIWERFVRRNAQVIRFENMTGRFLSGIANITIFYNITIPTKQGFDSTDYIPIRWKFWFLRWSANDPYMNQTCVNQNREFKNVEPYCNPLVAQYIVRPTFNYTLNISLRPSLSIGNYTVIREVEIDPEYVWVTHARGPIGSIEVIEDTYDELQGTGVGSVTADKDNIYVDNEKIDEAYAQKLPTPTILTLKGEKNLLHGSLKVVITDTYTPLASWTQIFNDAINNGVYELKVGEEKQLNLIRGREYELAITLCEGPVFDEQKYNCNTEKKIFTA